MRDNDSLQVLLTEEFVTVKSRVGVATRLHMYLKDETVLLCVSI